jgi:hypothetical protein
VSVDEAKQCCGGLLACCWSIVVCPTVFLFIERILLSKQTIIQPRRPGPALFDFKITTYFAAPLCTVQIRVGETCSRAILRQQSIHSSANSPFIQTTCLFEFHCQWSRCQCVYELFRVGRHIFLDYTTWSCDLLYFNTLVW